MDVALNRIVRERLFGQAGAGLGMLASLFGTYYACSIDQVGLALACLGMFSALWIVPKWLVRRRPSSAAH